MSNPQAETMARVAAKRKAAADLARKIVREYVPTPCGCEHCSEWRHARKDFAKIAQEISDPNGMSDTHLWIAYRELKRSEGA